MQHAVAGANQGEDFTDAGSFATPYSAGNGDDTLLFV
jgi:hypothetical protein